MSRTAAALTTLAILAAVTLGLILWQQNGGLDPQLPERVEELVPASPPESSAAEPEIQFPIAVEETPEAPIPALDESDDTLRIALGNLIGARTFQEVFLPQSVIRRIVVTVDNLPREVVAERLRPVQPARGAFRVQNEDGRTYIDAKNAQRYKPYVDALEKLNVEAFTKLYVRFYPLFQSAYRDLGYPKGYFNDRLVEVIDHMLAAPQLDGRAALVQPHVFYRYADPGMESASAGHKLMWRVGNENASRIKAKLREIRAAVTTNSAALRNETGTAQ